jgi:hypothetical protein
MRCFVSILVLFAVVFVMPVHVVQAEMVLSNVAAHQPSTASPNTNPQRGNDDGVYRYYEGANDINSWWRVDLGQAYSVDHVDVLCRIGYHARTNGVPLRAYAADGTTQVGSTITISGLSATVLEVSYNNGGPGWNGVRYFQIGGVGESVAYMDVGDFQVYSLVEKKPYFITGVTATATDTYSHSGVSPMFTVDHSGMDDQRTLVGNPDGKHIALSGQGLWHTNSGTTATKSITFDLQRAYTLDQMVVWNQHQGQANRAMKECLIEYSTDGTAFTAMADRNGEAGLGNYTLHDLLTANGPYEATDKVDMMDSVARYVRITAKSSYGTSLAYVGLSEVRFYEVPEPSTLALLAIGALLLVCRKSKK